jgi:hypothetical protein
LAVALLLPVSASAHRGGGDGWGWGLATGAIIGAELANPYYYRPYYYSPYYYPPTVVVTQPAPTTYVAPEASSVGYWYYCESAKGYYPYVAQCPEAWKTVPAAPPVQPPH